MTRRRVDITELLDQARGLTSDAALLDALLEAYRARPLPALADLIALAGKRVATEHALTGSQDHQHATWLAVAVQQRATDLEWLIANLTTSRDKDSTERIDRLKGWPADPRLALGLLALVDRKKLSSRGSRNLWRIGFGILNRQVHPGLAPILAPLLEIAPQTEFEHLMLKRLRALAGKLDALVPASPSTTERAALAALTVRLEVVEHRAAEQTADDLLQAVYAAPDDDGPREVYADWLQERGDPRGEFITLQLARRRRLATVVRRDEVPADATSTLAHEKALLAKHREAWAAPFEALLSLPHCTFERGFLHTVRVHWRKLALVPALMTHPAWATVRRFSIHADGEQPCEPWIDHVIALGAKRD